MTISAFPAFRKVLEPTLGQSVHASGAVLSCGADVRPVARPAVPSFLLEATLPEPACGWVASCDAPAHHRVERQTRPGLILRETVCDAHVQAAPPRLPRAGVDRSSPRRPAAPRRHRLNPRGPTSSGPCPPAAPFLKHTVYLRAQRLSGGTMPVTRLNHAVLYVRDVERTRDSTGVLGFARDLMPGQAAFFQAPGSTNDHDLGTFQIGAGAGPRRPVARPSASTTWPGRSTPWPSSSASAACSPSAGALVGASDHVTTKALYAQRPRRHRVRGVLARARRSARRRGRAGVKTSIPPARPGAEIERYGADTLGGIGVSIPVPG